MRSNSVLVGMLCGALLALVAPALGAQSTETELALDAQAPCAPIEHVVQTRGELRVWIESIELDPLVRIEDEAGRVLAGDDDSGGGTTAFVAVPVQGGERLRIVGACKSGAGRALLHVHASCDTQSARELWQVVQSAAEDFELAVRHGRIADAAALAQGALDELSLSPDLACNDELRVLYLYHTLLASSLDKNELALKRLRELEALESKVSPPTAWRLQQVRMRLGEFLVTVGKPEQGLPYIEGAVTTLACTRPPDDPMLLLTRNSFGQTLSMVGAAEAARQQLAIVLENWEKTADPDGLGLNSLRCNYAGVLLQLGLTSEARAIAERALEALDRSLPPEDLRRLYVRQVVATTLIMEGDYARARVLLEEALATAQKALPAGSPEEMAILTGLGHVLYSQGDYAGSLRARERVARGTARLFPETEPRCISSDINLGIVLSELGRADEAVPILERALRNALATMPAGSETVRLARTNLGLARFWTGEVERGLELLDQAYDGTLALYGPGHQELVHARHRRILALAALQRSSEVQTLVEESARDLRELLTRNASLLSGRELESLVRSLRRSMSLLLSVHARPDVEHDRRELELDLAMIESARNIAVTSATAARARGSEDAVAHELQADYRHKAERLARAVRLGEEPQALSEKLTDKERAERALLKHLESQGLLATPAPITVDGLAERLEPDQAAVGYWVYRRIASFGARPEPARDSLMALVVSRGADDAAHIERVELGALEDVLEPARAWRLALEDPETPAAALRAAGQRVRERLIDPVRARAPHAKRWIAALDVPLVALPIDALPEQHGALGDVLSIEIRASLSLPPRPALPRAELPGLLLVGDPDYARDGAAREAGAATGATRAGTLKALAASAAEVQTIAALFQKQFSERADLTLLRGPAATTEAFLARVSAARFVHVATHGTAEVVADALGMRAESGGEAVRSNVETLVPLVRSSLAFAGANFDPRAELTAEQMSALDLSGCELVVLSACDTNRGETFAGQGIASFQKALHAAGARYTLTSLWKVSDAATRELMEDFYRGLWVERLTPEAALWRAKANMRARRAPAAHWAAWVLSRA